MSKQTGHWGWIRSKRTKVLSKYDEKFLFERPEEADQDLVQHLAASLMLPVDLLESEEARSVLVFVELKVMDWPPERGRIRWVQREVTWLTETYRSHFVLNTGFLCVWTYFLIFWLFPHRRDREINMDGWPAALSHYCRQHWIMTQFILQCVPPFLFF